MEKEPAVVTQRILESVRTKIVTISENLLLNMTSAKTVWEKTKRLDKFTVVIVVRQFNKIMIKEKYSIKDFLPLIVIFIVIFLFSFYRYNLSGGDIYVGMRYFMAGFFIIFGLLKVIKLKAFAEAYQMYDLLAKRSLAYAYFYPFIELSLGASYYFNYKPVLTNQITVVVMLIGALGVYLKLRKKEEIPCACLGTVFKVPMTWVTLFEDLLMAAMALVMLLQFS